VRAGAPRGRRGSPRAGLAIAVAAAVAAVAAAGCAPQLDGPLERQRAIDRDEADRLAALLAALPGAVAANVVLHHAFRDPLAAAPPIPATFAAVITVDDRADRDAIRAAATRLARAAVPELAAAAAPATAPAIEPVIVIDPAVHRPALARVGPFSVEDGSRAPLKLALALGCATIAALAAALALRAGRHRRGNSAQ
jgi:hypothetical protein